MATAEAYNNYPTYTDPSTGEPYLWSGDTTQPNYPTGLNAVNTGQSIWSQIKKWFTGADDSQTYQNLLTENNREYEQALIQSQRDYENSVRQQEYAREDTKIQRTIADMKAAGLNPWLALQGGFSGSTAQSQPTGSGNFNRGSSAKAADQKQSSGAVAGLLMATARVIAALLA